MHSREAVWDFLLPLQQASRPGQGCGECLPMYVFLYISPPPHLKNLPKISRNKLDWHAKM